MSTSARRETIYARFRSEGVLGIGEGAPIARYHEVAAAAVRTLTAERPALEELAPLSLEDASARTARLLPRQRAAQAAVDIARYDWQASRAHVPLYRMLGVDPEATPVTSYSIGIAAPAEVRSKVLEAAPYPVLKIKMGLGTDEAILDAVRGATSKPIRVDANEGWTDPETALRKIEWLSTQGVEFVEQPLPAGDVDAARWVHARSPLPIFADEAAIDADAVPGLVGAYDGVNIKLDKCGGITPALRMIRAARDAGLRTMLGCMVSSSVSVTAAAHLSPLVDYADLDGNLLIAHDPYHGVTVRGGRLVLPRGPGLGLVPAKARRPGRRGP